MRAFPVSRLFQQMFGAEGGKARRVSASAAMASPSSGTRRPGQARAQAPRRLARLCLGIGDGSVHRQ
ncbi:MAG TPA: hypothetical protein VME63_13020 [Dyella sp.]|uniref:hypothetical protein n=1 Tax=Dyella sp. TaxID=1869338 RepID=UPI002C0E1916|nr:hypothetical protein [Dyella sp.]HTV86328.1 hypothetical protein [Dyella sp.]